MSRWVRFFLIALLGVVLLVCGWLVPAHLRAVDIGVLRLAGKGTPSLIDHGLRMVEEKQLGTAELFLQAAIKRQIPGQEKLAAEAVRLAGENSRLAVLGSPDLRLGGLGLDSPKPIGAQPFTTLVLRLENRGRILDTLKASPRAATQDLLRTRSLTNTVLIPPSSSASGQAFDAAVSITGLLLDGGHFSPAVSDSVVELTSEVNRGMNPQRYEQMLLDVLSLGQRLNWGQLVAFVKPVENLETIRLLANVVRKDESQLPVLFAALRLSGKPEAVVKYAIDFSETGLIDLGTALRYGTGSVKELLDRHQRIHNGGIRREIIKYDPFGGFYEFALSYSWLMPWSSLAIKWILYLVAGFLLASSLHYRRAVPELEQPLQVPGFHFAKEGLFALGFLLAALLFSEPFLAQDQQKADFPFRWRLPLATSVAPAATLNAPATTSFMNQVSLLTLLLFFVLQALIYTACLLKLAEIRRQNVPARTKLKLLDNEDHLFDAGLYLGFVGTIISLILVSLGVTKFSVMAAYSSTSFGIIFVSVFKVFNLRPVRRKLLMESEMIRIESAPKPATPTLIAHT